MSQDVLQGQWCGGETASAVAVTVYLEPHGLSIRGPGGRQLNFWGYGDLISGAPILGSASDVLLRNRRIPRATLFVQGQGAGRLILAHAPQTSENTWRLRVVGFGLIATAIVAAAGIVLFFGQTSLAKTAGGLIPPHIASRIGERHIEMFGPIAPACQNQPGNAALQRILDRLRGGRKYGPDFKLHVAKSSVPNAFALPGGHIVLLSALVKQAKSPEEVAGVLAHEMGHEIEKDPEALFVRNAGIATLISLLSGQPGGDGALNAGAFLLQLRYSRDAERSADLHAIELLRNAGVEPKPTADFFLRHDWRRRQPAGLFEHPPLLEGAGPAVPDPAALSGAASAQREGMGGGEGHLRRRGRRTPSAAAEE